MRLGRSVSASCRAMCAIRSSEALAFGYVFMRCQPTAARNRLVDDGKCPTVRQVDNVVEGLSFGNTVFQPGNVFIGIAGETPELDSVLDQIDEMATRLYNSRRKSVQLDITLVTKR